MAYVSDTQENLKKVAVGVNPQERAHTLAQIKKMKADLTVTNFRLGDENPSYETTSRSAMSQTGGFERPAVQSGESSVKEMIKKSSLHFGNEPVDYQSVSHSAMEYKGSAANYIALKDEVNKMANTLRQHNFSFGEEKVVYQSDYSRGYGSVPLESYRAAPDRKTKMRAIIEDSRSCHFSLGNDSVRYESNTQHALAEVLSRNQEESKQSVERAKEMKAALQKTSFIIGDDDEYM